MNNTEKTYMIMVDEVVDLIKKHTLPKELAETEKVVRTKEEYFDIYEKLKASGYGKFEEMLGDLCYRMPERKMKYKGYCSVCGKNSLLEIDYMFSELTGNDLLRLPIWRERMVCDGCRLNNRMRYILGKVKESYKDGMKVYMNEQVTNAYRELKKHIPDLVGSEYLDANFESGRVENGILHEDAMNLSFLDETFDIIVSQDVFEHVADCEMAFKEMARVLITGGKALFTVPFDTLADTIDNRAKIINGEIEYIKEAVYHGNPLSDKGSLVFNIFSWDLFTMLKECGFKDAYAITYYNVENGNIGLLPFYIIAEK